MTDQVQQNQEGATDASYDPRAENEAAAANASQGNAASQDDQASLEARVAEAERAAQDAQNRYLRTRADMENYRKSLDRRHADLVRSSKVQLLTKLLQVKDNIERALRYGETGSSGTSLMEGVRLTQYQLDQLLDQEGVQMIEAEGKPFDPRLEEAVQTVAKTDVPDHTVVHVERQGYTYQDQVLRPAQVVVSTGGPDHGEAPGSGG